MYYTNSNATFQPELLNICGDVHVNPGPVSKRNQARSTAPTCPVCEKAVAKNQRRFVCWMCRDMMHVRYSSSTADSWVFSISLPVSWTCNRCAFASLPFFKESWSDDFNTLTFSSAVQSSNEELSTILRKYSKNLKIGHININSVAGFKFYGNGLPVTLVISQMFRLMLKPSSV